MKASIALKSFAEQQRRAMQAPERHVRVFLVRCQAGLVSFLGRDFQHVGIVPMARARNNSAICPVQNPGLLMEFQFALMSPVVRQLLAIAEIAGAVGDVHVVRQTENDVAPAVRAARQPFPAFPGSSIGFQSYFK